MLGQYLPLLGLLVLAVLFAAGSFFASKLFAPQRPTQAKEAAYECGIVSESEGLERFPVKFFLVAMIFIVFDVEIIFIYPWTMVYRELGGYGLGAMLIFSFMVFESFVYLIGQGALEWGPLKKVERSGVVSADRTSGSTIRRVGLEGREQEAA